jgi:hypothetical protein
VRIILDEISAFGTAGGILFGGGVDTGGEAVGAKGVRAGEEGDGMGEYVEADGAAEVWVGGCEEEGCWVAHCC